MLVLDHNFDNEPGSKGVDLAIEIASGKSVPPIMISTDDLLSQEALPPTIAVIPKGALSWEALQRLRAFGSSTEGSAPRT